MPVCWLLPSDRPVPFGGPAKSMDEMRQKRRTDNGVLRAASNLDRHDAA